MPKRKRIDVTSDENHDVSCAGDGLSPPSLELSVEAKSDILKGEASTKLEVDTLDCSCDGLQRGAKEVCLGAETDMVSVDGRCSDETAVVSATSSPDRESTLAGHRPETEEASRSRGGAGTSLQTAAGKELLSDCASSSHSTSTDAPSGLSQNSQHNHLELVSKDNTDLQTAVNIKLDTIPARDLKHDEDKPLSQSDPGERSSFESVVESLSDKEIENDSVFELAENAGVDGACLDAPEESSFSAEPQQTAEKDDDLEPPRKKKRSVQFNDVTVYFFPRKQGFTCVPSQGGSTLGMADSHAQEETYSISEYACLQRQIHKTILLEQHRQGKIHIPLPKLHQLQRSASSNSSSSGDAQFSSDDSEEEDLAIDDYYFLQPVPTRQRRVMLRQAGIKKIDAQEKDVCKEIRLSREVCGCDCKGVCDPATCICALAHIKCQVDRVSFPCGCSKECCKNPAGRVEFNPIRVRTHFIHTLMRLENDRKMEQRKRALAMARKRQQMTQSPSHIRFDDQGRPVKSPAATAAHGSGNEPGEESNDEEGRDEGDVLSRYNSNEMGSCRDCQTSEVSQFLMRQQQQYRAQQQVQYNQQQQQQQVYNAEEPYIAENTTDMFGFAEQEESSYSESSEDCSSEGSNPEQEQSAESQGFAPCQQQGLTPKAGAQPSGVSTQGHMAASVNVVSASQGHMSRPNLLSSPGYGIPPFGSPTTTPKFNPLQQQLSTAQAEQKYMDMNTNPASSFKLEPISEILNPLRFPGFGGSGLQSWTMPSPSFDLNSSTSQPSVPSPSTQYAAPAESFQYVSTSPDNSHSLLASQTDGRPKESLPVYNATGCTLNTTPALQAESPQSFCDSTATTGYGNASCDMASRTMTMALDTTTVGQETGFCESAQDKIKQHGTGASHNSQTEFLSLGSGLPSHSLPSAATTEKKSYVELTTSACQSASEAVYGSAQRLHGDDLIDSDPSRKAESTPQVRASENAGNVEANAGNRDGGLPADVLNSLATVATTDISVAPVDESGTTTFKIKAESSQGHLTDPVLEAKLCSEPVLSQASIKGGSGGAESDLGSKSETSSTGTTDDSEDSGLGSLSDDTNPTRDGHFGEIIKKSMVETVSA